MTPEQALFLRGFLMPGVRSEYETTRRVLAAVPNDNADYQPHEKSMKIGQLAEHIAIVDVWFLESIVKGEFIYPSDMSAEVMPPSASLAYYEEKMPALLDQVEALSGEHLAKIAKFHTFELPLVGYLQFMNVHSIHHRGQLSAYLRPAGARVPSIYGGSADEPMTAEAQA